MQDLRTWSKTHKDWVDDFVVELREYEVPGNVIGDQLATVFSHCEETGETPEHAFGKPRDYAQSLGFEPQGKTQLFMAITPLLITLLAMFVFNYGVSAMANHHPFMLNYAVATTWGLAVILVVIMLFVPYRKLVKLPVLLLLFGVGAPALGITGALLSRKDLPLVVNTDPIPVVAISGVVMVAAAVMATRSMLISSDEDIMVSPLDNEKQQRSERRKAKILSVIPCWIIPIYALISAVVGLSM